MIVRGNLVDHANVGVIVFGVTCDMRGMIRRGRGTGIFDVLSHRMILLWCDITQMMHLTLSGFMVSRVRHEWWTETSETQEAGLTAHLLFEDGSVEDKWA